MHASASDGFRHGELASGRAAARGGRLRLVRRPWELHLPSLGYCGHGCMCEALLGARNETVCCSGVGWGEYGTPCNGAGWYGLPGGPDDPDGLTYICRA